MGNINSTSINDTLISIWEQQNKEIIRQKQKDRKEKQIADEDEEVYDEDELLASFFPAGIPTEPVKAKNLVITPSAPEPAAPITSNPPTALPAGVKVVKQGQRVVLLATPPETVSDNTSTVSEEEGDEKQVEEEQVQEQAKEDGGMEDEDEQEQDQEEIEEEHVEEKEVEKEQVEEQHDEEKEVEREHGEEEYIEEKQVDTTVALPPPIAPEPVETTKSKVAGHERITSKSEKDVVQALAHLQHLLNSNLATKAVNPGTTAATEFTELWRAVDLVSNYLA
jgi:hypothetical protein